MKVHLINPMDNPYGGAEARTVELAKLITGSEVAQIWAESRGPLKQSTFGKVKVNRIRPLLGQFPRKGHLVFVGAYFWVGRWLRWAAPHRITILLNTDRTTHLQIMLTRIQASNPQCSIELCYAANWLLERTGIPGYIMPSPIDLDRFRPRALPSRGAQQQFTIGRMSRQFSEKHHPEDIRLYKALASKGFRIRIMGSTEIHESLRGIEGVDLLPAGTEDPAKFLASLDCFFYRTSPIMFEPHGRVIHEAMAAGLPVVAGRAGGYNECINDGVNGFLIDSTEEALERLETLARSAESATAIGIAGRCTVEELFSPAVLNRLREHLVADQVLSGQSLGALLRILATPKQ